MMHATNSDMIPVRTMTAADNYIREAEARRKRLLGKATTPVNLNEVRKERDQLSAELEQAKQRIAELELYGQEMEALAGDYCRTLMRYIKENEDVDAALRITPKFRPVVQIIRETLRGFPSITFEDVVGPKRTRPIIKARFACIWAVKKERKDLSYPQMGRIFRRDHSSIISAVRQMPDDLMVA